MWLSCGNYTKAMHRLHGASILSRPPFFSTVLNSACLDSKPSAHNVNSSTATYPGIDCVHSKEHQSIHIVSQVPAKYPGTECVQVFLGQEALSPGVGSSKTPSRPPPFVTKHNGRASMTDLCSPFFSCLFFA